MKISRTLAAILGAGSLAVGSTLPVDVTVWTCPDGRVRLSKADTVQIAGPDGGTVAAPVEAVTPSLQGCQPQGRVTRMAVVALWSPQVVLSETPAADLDQVALRELPPSCVEVRSSPVGGTWQRAQLDGTAPYSADPRLQGRTWRLRAGAGPECDLAAAPRLLRRVARGGDPRGPWR